MTSVRAPKFHRHLVSQAVDAVCEIFSETQYADKVIERILKSQPKWGARDRRFFAESVYEIVRWWRYLGALAGLDLGPQTKISRELAWQVWAAWCFKTYQTLPEWEELKSFDPTAFETRKSVVKNKAILESVPDWLYQRGQQELGSEWDALLHSLNDPAEVFLRVNSLRGTRDQALSQLQKEGAAVVPVPELSWGLKLVERKNIASLESFKQGLIEVQDAASQLVAPLLGAQPGEFVIDACAGGGGKSLHLASLMKNKGRILSMDVHGWKLKNLQERARRNKVDIIETRAIENPGVIEKLNSSADRVLLDVPCSALGVLRRNPDTKWKLHEEDLHDIQKLQSQILRDYSKMVKVGGTLVYATCSVLPSENHQQVQKFLEADSAAWELIEEIHTFPHRQGFDGFYGALLRRKK